LNCFYLVKYFKIIWICLFIIFPKIFWAQNLVPNSSFENYKKLPTALITDHIPLENYIYDWQGYNSVDYYNANETALLVKIPFITYPPGYLATNKDTIQIHVYPKSGIAFTGIANEFSNEYHESFYYSEYIKCNLKTTLTKNAKYRGFFYYFNIGFQSFIISDLGMLVSSDSNITLYNQANHSPTYYGNVPQILNKEGLITTENSWKMISGVFKAKGDEKFLTIGYFKQPNSPEVLDSSNAYIVPNYISSFGNYFYIDSVSLTEIPGIVGNDSVCKNDEITFYSTFPGPFTWVNKNDTTNILSTDSIFRIKADQSGWFCLYTPYGNDSIYLTVNDPKLFIGSDSSFCEGKELNLHAVSNSNIIIWQNNSVSKDFVVNKGGIYWAKTCIGNCVNYDSVNITENPLPEKLVQNNFEFCSVEQQNLILKLPPTYSYIWQDGDTSSIKTLNIAGFIKLKITSQYDCSIFDSIFVDDICQPNVFVPNAFAPNGINKTFKPVTRYVNKIDWSIFNRWGEEIFKTEDLNDFWDGTYRKIPCDAGVYLYKIKFMGEVPNSIYKTITGTVTLIK